jgi:molybdopterin/thiamine biosynthesis adenylyltransferase
MAPHSNPTPVLSPVETGSGRAEGALGPALSEAQVERYSRQIILPQVGGRGQLALLGATVTICGSTELATTAALYLAGAGVGHLRVSPPTAAAIDGLNPDCHVAVSTSDAAPDVVGGARVVLCAAASEAAGARIHAACVAAGVPLLVGDATATAGWMSACAGSDGACYTCLTRQRRCADGGAPLGTVTAGFIGTLLATEAIKIVLGLRPSSVGRRLTFDALGAEIRVEAVTSDPQCITCGGA